ncbi:hypothetical protein GLOIN_2v1552219 [Rhizophagus irregularis DAOM 181602=DAOM 197198]|uniref:Uncharacterized protein n=1 Tax=Rhizophagus irregularis (strain DAOM 181602 / DAOM 197198 / MUCL 43194) TaxID=747089 RepID=A0A2P4QH97_RHIID|nr:hypothetical protein GLOIN_2v1552219 [Rhizophagus irregularis DAOM 181602=DAOM 197198]POG76986.1 hypothetical protein GLOIN_2v1552219 [Rhizophagus irregularis DAOM 181602=DAOM 197198]|eukprot:XP_025183852.1 hypothetical protein GLOIN_2v1552219 [Rhizophagus irregularis DAOM 181602=DAOM 197198]
MFYLRFVFRFHFIVMFLQFFNLCFIFRFHFIVMFLQLFYLCFIFRFHFIKIESYFVIIIYKLSSMTCFCLIRL